MINIAVFTGTRADYGLLYQLLKILKASHLANLQLLVGGTHLSHQFGYTIDQIKQDDFEINYTLNFLSDSDSIQGIAQSLAQSITESSKAMLDGKPDLIVILGDRYEALGVAQSALINGVPIAHIHGGEVTEGAFDDSIRHSITKMAHLHFTCAERYRQRVIQLGENPNNVFNVGAPGLDNINHTTLLSREQLNDYFNGQLTQDFFIVTYHPETMAKNGGLTGFDNMVTALNQYPHYQLIITYPNADTHGQRIIEAINELKVQQPSRVFVVKSMGQTRYLSALKFASAVIGNSSSGVIEAPSFYLPTINIGERQTGRIRHDSVIDCQSSLEGILAGLEQAVSQEFITSIKQQELHFGDGYASVKIADILINLDVEKLSVKSFYDLP